MRILLLTVYYLPSQKASAKLIHDLGVELCRQGHEVTILAPAPEIHDPCEVSFEGTLRIVRVKVGRIEDASKAVRAIRESQLSVLDLAPGWSVANAKSHGSHYFLLPSHLLWCIG